VEGISNIGVDVEFLKVIRYHEEVDVVDPHHVFLSFYLYKVMFVALIEITVVVPEVDVSIVDVVILGAFEASEDSP